MLMRRFSFLAAVALTVFVALSSQPQSAAAQFRVGPHLGYNFDVERGFVGADAWFGLTKVTETIELHGDVGFSWYLIDGITLFSIDFNVPFLFELSSPMVRPYAAPGISIRHTSFDVPGLSSLGLSSVSDTNIGLNLIGGALFLTDGIFQPFAQLRVVVNNDSTAELMGGLLIEL